MIDNKNYFIGVFDSGIGGLSCVKEIIKLVPKVNIIYCADNTNCPYAEREKDEIMKFAFNNLHFLENEGSSVLLIASNTCSSIALVKARKEFNIPVLGIIDPAITKLSEIKSVIRIGLIGTQSLIKSKVYYKKIKKIIPKAMIHEINLNNDDIYTIERNLSDKNKINELIQKILNPLINKVDVILIGCTHLYFLKQKMIDYFNNKITLIDPSEQIALDIKQDIDKKNIYFDEGKSPEMKCYVSGEIKYFKKFVEENITDFPIRKISFAIRNFHIPYKNNKGELY